MWPFIQISTKMNIQTNYEHAWLTFLTLHCASLHLKKVVFVVCIHGKGEQKWQQRDISSPSTLYPMHMTPSMITVVEFKVKRTTRSTYVDLYMINDIFSSKFIWLTHQSWHIFEFKVIFKCWKSSKPFLILFRKIFQSQYMDQNKTCA